MLCLVSARFNMTAKVLVQSGDADPDTPEFSQGHYVYDQDPDSGGIIRVWKDESDSDPDDPDYQTGGPSRTFPCIARGVIDGGIRVSGTTERYTPAGIYENIDYIQMTYPADVILTKRDRVTEIRGANGELIWKEEEYSDAATQFDVMGVIPIVDPFGNHIENQTLLKRSGVQ